MTDRRTTETWRRFTAIAALFAVIALAGAPLGASPVLATPIAERTEASIDQTSWMSRIAARLAALLGWVEASGHTRAERAPGDAQQAHHLTIEPGGDAVPPPIDEDDGNGVPNGG